MEMTQIHIKISPIRPAGIQTNQTGEERRNKGYETKNY
jgi:hypothetical protein